MATQQIFVLSIVPLDSSVVIFVCLFVLFCSIFSPVLLCMFFVLFFLFSMKVSCSDTPAYFVVITFYQHTVSRICVGVGLWSTGSVCTLLLSQYYPLTIFLNVNHAESSWNKQQYDTEKKTLLRFDLNYKFDSHPKNILVRLQ